MSALGQKRRFDPLAIASALPSATDLRAERARSGARTGQTRPVTSPAGIRNFTRSIHRSLHERRPSGYHAQIRIRLRLAICHEIHIHDNRPRLALPCRQDRGGDGTRPRLFYCESRDAWERLRGLRYAGLIALRVSARSNQQGRKERGCRLDPHPGHSE
jgi:hypothetical protein